MAVTDKVYEAEERILRLYDYLALELAKNFMKKSISVPRGSSDILPEDIAQWCGLEAEARNLLEIYGYNEIRTPMFEETELFARSVGQTSDIVQKQMLNLLFGKLVMILIGMKLLQLLIKWKILVPQLMKDFLLWNLIYGSILL